MYGWGSSTICNILEKREYLGHTINFKTRKHFKDKKSHYVPEDEWTIFENTHEAIIDQQTFDPVSYTHLDVYKRQPRHFANSSCVKECFFRKSRTFSPNLMFATFLWSSYRTEMCIRDRAWMWISRETSQRV